jgi:hypothetical protein
VGRRPDRCRRLLAAALAALVLPGCGSGAEPAGTTAALPATIQAPTLTRDDLPGLVLRLADLPEGFSVREESFVETRGRVQAAFRRVFDPGNARLGGSSLAVVFSDVGLFDTPDRAKAALSAVAAGLVSARVEENFADLVHAYTGIRPANLSGRTLESPTVGDGAVVADALFDTEAGRVEALLLVVRVGRLHGNLFLIGLPGEVRIEDAAPLMSVVVGRLEAAAGREPAA